MNKEIEELKDPEFIQYLKEHDVSVEKMKQYPKLAQSLISLWKSIKAIPANDGNIAV